MSSEILTRQQCETVLKNALNADDFLLTDYRITPSSDNGFLGEYFKLDVEYVVGDRPKRSRYFVKRVPDVGTTRNIVADFITETNAFNKEVFFYRHVIGDARVEWAPAFHFSKTDELVVLDDVTCRGYEPPPRINELDATHCEVALDTVARFHAFCVAYERRRSVVLGRQYRTVDEYPDAFREVLFRDDAGSLGREWFDTGARCFHAFVDEYPNSSATFRETFKREFDRRFHEARVHVRPSDRYFNTISHGDIWSNNLLFRSNEDGKPEHCYLIDYQLIRYNPPANDVLMFIMFNTSLEFQNERLSELLVYYHGRLVDELSRNGIDCSEIVPWDQFEESCREFTTTWKLVRFAYLSVHLLDDEIIEELLRDTQKYQDMMFFKREKVLLDVYKRDAEYREKILRMMDDVKRTLSID